MWEGRGQEIARAPQDGRWNKAVVGWSGARGRASRGVYEAGRGWGDSAHASLCVVGRACIGQSAFQLHSSPIPARSPGLVRAVSPIPRREQRATDAPFMNRAARHRHGRATPRTPPSCHRSNRLMRFCTASHGVACPGMCPTLARFTAVAKEAYASAPRPWDEYTVSASSAARCAISNDHALSLTTTRSHA